MITSLLLNDFILVLTTPLTTCSLNANAKCIERDEAFKIAKSKPTPSVAATLDGLRQAQAQDPILNGRPFAASGPPITIYEPIFSDFRAMSKGETPISVSQEDYKSVKDFLVASSQIYLTEMDRQTAINKPLTKILDKVIDTTILEDGTSNGGVITHSFGANACLLLIREVKNEIGSSSGDPSVQVGFSYTRWWASTQVKLLGTAAGIIPGLILSRDLTSAIEHAAPASSSPSRVPGFACKEEFLPASAGRFNR